MQQVRFSWNVACFTDGTQELDSLVPNRFSFLIALGLANLGFAVTYRLIPSMELSRSGT
jgi:hypothetical protein